MLLVGTSNRHKLEEIRRILRDVSVDVTGAEILSAEEPVGEEGRTFEDNARAKATEFARRAARLPPSRRPRWVVADDSGLCVDALDGEPGVRSARYAGEGSSAEANNRKLLEALAGTPDGARGARFVCVLALASVPAVPDEEPPVLFVVEGACRGRITREPRGEGGFGYDPLFVPEGGERTFAELPPEEKNSVSHRGRALAEFRRSVAELLARGAPGLPGSPGLDATTGSW